VALLGAGVGVLAERGWGGFTLAEVARAMGTSISPVRRQVRSPDDLSARLWLDDLWVRVEPQLRAVVTSLDSQEPQRLVAAFNDMRSRTREHDATAEIIVVARHEPTLLAAVDKTLGVFIRSHTTDRRPRDRADAARASYAMQLALGLLLSNCYPRMQGKLDQALTRLARALFTEQGATRLPSRSANHADEWPTLAPGDPVLEAVLRSTLQLISDRGYEGATIMDIATDAGVTEGFIYGRYATKWDLLQDALRKQHAAGWEVTAAFIRDLEDVSSPGLASAVLLREYLKPGRDLGRNMALELLRLARHSGALLTEAITAMDASDPGGRASDDFTVDSALDFGTYLLPKFAPESYRLPFDTITVPLSAIRRER